ncbi:MAG: hypothetical protein LUI06_05435 [Ruminococcus sp.]|nr:hypothetical protein [Ruminococcus sp.]
MSNVKVSKLYRGCDGMLYEIFSLDSDCSVLLSSDGKDYIAAVKPYFDKKTNKIDFADSMRFHSLDDALTYQKELKALFNQIRIVKKKVDAKKIIVPKAHKKI